MPSAWRFPREYDCCAGAAAATAHPGVSARDQADRPGVLVDRCRCLHIGAAAYRRAAPILLRHVHGRRLGQALTKHPEANVAVGGSWLAPRIAQYGSVDVKLALDKTDGGVRHVASAVIRDVASLDVEGIQAHVDRLRDTPAAELDELAGSRLLDRLPPLLGTWAFGFATRLSRRSEVLGTVALSSLGHADVHAFHSDGGTAVTIGMGAIAPRPVCVPDREGNHAVQARSVLPLSLTFDHRALDGAAAADLLTTLSDILRAGVTA